MCLTMGIKNDCVLRYLYSGHLSYCDVFLTLKNIPFLLISKHISFIETFKSINTYKYINITFIMLTWQIIHLHVSYLISSYFDSTFLFIGN